MSLDPQHLPKLEVSASLSFDSFLNEKLISLVVPAWERVNTQRCLLLSPPGSHPPSLQPKISDKNTPEQSAPPVRGIAGEPEQG